MKKRIIALSCVLFLLLTMLPLFTSCGCSSTKSISGNMEAKDSLTVKLVDKAIYKDENGNSYYINIDNTEYLHTIGGSVNGLNDILHSFTKTPPTEIEGFYISISSNLYNSDISEDELRDPFSNKLESPSGQFSTGPSEYLKLFHKSTIWKSLATQSTFMVLLNSIDSNLNSNYYGNWDFSNIDWVACQQSFKDNNMITIPFKYNGQSKCVTIQIKTFTYYDIVEFSYTFNDGYSILKIPYYDYITGELTAYYNTIYSTTTLPQTTGTVSLSFFEYQ